MHRSRIDDIRYALECCQHELRANRDLARLIKIALERVEEVDREEAQREEEVGS